MPIFYGNKNPNDGSGRFPGQGDASNPLGFLDMIQIAMQANRARQQGPIKTGFSGNLQNALNKPTGQIGSGLGIPQPGSIESIMERLEELQDPSRYMTPMEMMEREARAMAGAQYDPIIARLRNQMGLAEQRAGRNKEALGAMFNQLSGNLSAEIPEIQEMYQGAAQKTAGQYADLKNSITQQYSNSQAEQEEMMKRLNIEAAAPDVLQQQGVDRDYYVNRASTDAQTQASALGQEERGAVEYTRKGSQMAQTEGTQRQADLMFQLQDLLAQYEGQIGEAEIGRNQSYLSALYGLRNDSSKQAMDAAQRDFENYIKMIGVGQSLNKAGQAVTSVQSPADIANRALGMGVTPQGAQNIQNVFMSTISSDPMIMAGIDENFGQALPKEALAARVVEAGRNAGLSPQELNALQIAALEYFGRR